MDMTETTLERNVLYEGRIVTLRNDSVRLPNGKIADREVIEHPGGVTVAALTAEQELLFVRQFRYPYGQVLLELPAGKLERGEDPLLAGQRELAEETGASAAQYESLGLFYPTPGYCGEIIHMYLARELRFAAACPDADEFLLCERIPLQVAVGMVLRGEIRDGKTQAAVLKCALRLDTL
ncbi:MAG: NUDIX hydrolase [Oscillospiraceae bacterium]|jgi:ADP-ribose pyrophosphatase|nr:NUDIX hydrolase [Oscillospiraceae bacterium]